MSIKTGDNLGVFEIISPLGAGGMGEVWRARDTKLGREVAIKVLPEAFAKDSCTDLGNTSFAVTTSDDAMVVAQTSADGSLVLAPRRSGFYTVRYLDSGTQEQVVRIELNQTFLTRISLGATELLSVSLSLE